MEFTATDLYNKPIEDFYNDLKSLFYMKMNDSFYSSFYKTLYSIKDFTIISENDCKQLNKKNNFLFSINKNKIILNTNSNITKKNFIINFFILFESVYNRKNNFEVHTDTDYYKIEYKKMEKIFNNIILKPITKNDLKVINKYELSPRMNIIRFRKMLDNFLEYNLPENYDICNLKVEEQNIFNEYKKSIMNILNEDISQENLYSIIKHLNKYVSYSSFSNKELIDLFNKIEYIKTNPEKNNKEIITRRKTSVRVFTKITEYNPNLIIENIINSQKPEFLEIFNSYTEENIKYILKNLNELNFKSKTKKEYKEIINSIENNSNKINKINKIILKDIKKRLSLLVLENITKNDLENLNNDFTFI